jgi:hypothetical protein
MKCFEILVLVLIVKSFSHSMEMSVVKEKENSQRIKDEHLHEINKLAKKDDVTDRITNMKNYLKPKRKIVLRQNTFDASNFTTLSSFDNKSKEKYYQGSVLFNLLGNKTLPMESINLNVVNNFIISNSNVSQFISGPIGKNLTTVPPKENKCSNENELVYQDKIKKMNESYQLTIEELKNQMESKINSLQKQYNLDEEKIKDFNSQIKYVKSEMQGTIKNLENKTRDELQEIERYKLKVKKLNETFLKDKDDLKFYYEKKIKELLKKIEEKSQIIEKKEENEVNLKSEIVLMRNTNKSQFINKKESSGIDPNLKTTQNNNFNNKTNIKINSKSEDMYPVNYYKPKPNIIQPIKEKLFNNTEKNLTNTLPSLPCMDINSIEFHHFLMNYEKCKNLNSLYSTIYSNLKQVLKSGEQMNCLSYDCSFEILIKFTDDYTEISLFQTKDNQHSLIMSVLVSPAVFKILINDKKLKEMGKNEMKDFLVIYLYTPLTKILRLLPNFSQYNILVVAEGDYFDQMDDIEKPKFVKSLLSLQLIDDRFILDWNNIRIINQNEKKFNEYLSIKNSNNDQKNLVSLSISDKGVNLIGSEKKSEEKNSIDNLLNPSMDSSKTSLQLNNENVYSKNIDLMGINNLESKWINSQTSQNSQNIGNNSPKRNSYAYSGNYVNYPDISNSDELNLMELPRKSQNVFNDPTVNYLESYLDQNKILEKYFSQNEIQSLRTNNIRVNTMPFLSDFRFKEKNDMSRISINHIKNPCFNKGYYDPNANVKGTGNFDQCHLYLKNNFYIKQNYTLNEVNKDDFSKSQHSNDTKILLGKNFRNFKFLFYQKDSNDTLHFIEDILYSDFVKKVQNICSSPLNDLVKETKNFNLKSVKTLCYDLSYLTVFLEKNNISNSTILSMKSHQIKTNNKIINFEWDLSKLIFSHLAEFIIFSSSTILSILLILFNSVLPKNLAMIFIKYTNEYHQNHLNYLQVEDILSYFKIKQFLFYNEDAYFLKKYGKDFSYETCDRRLLNSEISELYRDNQSFRNVVLENKTYILEMIVSLSLSILIILLVITSIVYLCFILRHLYFDLGSLRTITTFLAFILISVVLVFSYKFCRIFRSQDQNDLEKKIEDKI